MTQTPREPRKPLRLILGATIVLLAACSGPRYQYPEAFVQRYEQGCESADLPEACLCVLEVFQDTVPYDDIRAFEKGEPPYQPYTNRSEASPEWEEMNRRIAEISDSCTRSELSRTE